MPAVPTSNLNVAGRGMHCHFTYEKRQLPFNGNILKNVNIYWEIKVTYHSGFPFKVQNAMVLAYSELYNYQHHLCLGGTFRNIDLFL